MINLITLGAVSINVEAIASITWNCNNALYDTPCDRITLTGAGLSVIHVFDFAERQQLRSCLAVRGCTVPPVVCGQERTP